uniref:5-taurinomethyluridine-[tRNA] synthase subunit GTPB3, mitochondrial n=1 Tax=Paramormyrops kingsleyae TaxID=1676925 RepID=A0A3B3S5R8_9TELE|nr:tRNA modification GTPase GTPBP3, mitochondrial isoform X1 [Paramormyrops kingsleyae]
MFLNSIAVWRISSFIRKEFRLNLTKNLCCKGIYDADTIFALSSGHGMCGVAVVRVSGPASALVLQSMAGLSRGLPPPRTAVLRNVTDPRSQELLDRGLVLWFPGPRSFTGEDSAEFHLHGGAAVITGVLQALGSVPGVRPAEAGEFTRRAFHAGKLDLTEVEGLGDLIHAETEAQRRQALRQMEGELSRLYQGWSQRLTRSLAHMEAFIDFSEDELIEEGVLNEVDLSVLQLQREIEGHLQDGRRAERLRSGVQAVIAGATNAGKSSFLNLLCQRPAAIVSPTAGTTRDVVETSLNIGGFPVVLSDTAGLRDTGDSVEMEGVRRAKERVQLADVTLVVVDSTQLPQNYQSVQNFLTDHLRSILPNGDDLTASLQRCLLVLNKRDLLSRRTVDGLQKSISQAEGLPLASLLSCQTGDGLDDFLDVFQDRMRTLCGDPLVGSVSLTQARHRCHLQQCVRALSQYHRYRDVDLALAAEGLRLALTSVGRITGKVGAEQILDIIFRDFCIGK